MCWPELQSAPGRSCLQPHHDLTITTTVTILTLVSPAPAMPLRSRLPNTGLKLKIPARSSASVAAAAAASPYGPSPRHSASPSRKKEAELFPSDHNTPAVPAPPASNGPGAAAACSVFDASVDSRPVWACVSSVSAARTDTGFREIPIRVSGGRGDRPPPAAPAPPHCDTARGSPVSPPLGDCELGPGSPPEDPLLHFTRGQFRTQRAQLLRDWISQLPTGRAPRAPRPNPFFSARKKDFNYEPYKYLSSPLPTFNQSPGSPAR